jgi:DNA-binding CsgD family transcriptional regulator
MGQIKVKTDYKNKPHISVSEIAREHRRAMGVIRRFHPVGNQFVYALSYLNDRIIYLDGSIENMLGYSPDEVKNVSFFYDRIHPDDVGHVIELTSHAIDACSDNEHLKPMDQVFHFIYRIRKNDGTYLKVQRQSGILTKDSSNRMLTSFGIYTDVSRLNNSEEVQVYMSGPEIPDFKFTNRLKESNYQFTRREQEIINLLARGMSSEMIGEKRFISKETVNTHRRNILKKAGVKNSTNLMAFVFKNGY